MVDIITADVTKSADVEDLVAAVMARHNIIDILINNVGQPVVGSPATISEDVWTRQIDINLTSVEDPVITFSVGSQPGADHSSVTIVKPVQEHR